MAKQSQTIKIKTGAKRAKSPKAPNPAPKPMAKKKEEKKSAPKKKK